MHGSILVTRHVPRPWRVFSPADCRPYRRLTADRVRVVAAGVLLALSAWHVGDANPAEQDAQRLLANLPEGARGLFEALERLGALWALAVLVLVLVVARRWRLGVVLGGAGATAWLIGRFMGFFVAEGKSFGPAVRAVFDGADVSYPAVPVAVIAAVLITASPFLVRPARRTGQVVLVLLALGALYQGSATVNAVFAALVLGWGLGALAHLLYGSPAGRPSIDEVAAALDELGVDATSVRLLPVQSLGCSLLEADRADGSVLPVRVYGRDASDTRLVAKAWRFLMYKDSGPTLTLTRLQQVEHEALCLMAAREADVRVPGVVAVGVAGAKSALLVTTPTGGRPLTEGGAADVAAVWRELAKLRAARIAHGALDLEHVVLAPDGPVLLDLSLASISAPQGRLDQDVAQLLVASALVVGAEAAVAAAIDALGTEAVAAALPLVQKPALTRSTRAALHHQKHLLDEVHGAITQSTAIEVLEPIELRRVKPLNVLMVVGLLFALWVILGEVGSISNLIDTLESADWAWVVVVVVLTQSTNLSYAMATVGSVDNHVPYGPAVVMQYAVAFTNLVAPSGVASGLMNIRFLQKQGAPISVATSSGVILGLSGTIASFALFVLTAFAVGQEGVLDDVGGGGDGQLILVVVFVASLLIGIVFLLPRLRRTAREKWWPPVAQGFRNVWSVLSSPRKLVMVLGGAVGAQLLYSLALGAALAAYGAGGELSFVELVFINTSASFLASLTPVPGGMGVTEAALIAGLTAFGITGDTASAAVITQRLFTTYLPPIPGSYATKWLIANDQL
ncbi:MAG TPA: lysylphosphatidylglycerol synthase transmembrane domain-containing protein [Acidimicrobiia bacterium]